MKPTKEELEQGYYNPSSTYSISTILVTIMTCNAVYERVGFIWAVATIFILPIFLMGVWAYTNPIRSKDYDQGNSTG